MLFHSQHHKPLWHDLVISFLFITYLSFLMFFIGTLKDQCHIPCSEPYLFKLGDHRVVLASPLQLEYLQDQGVHKVIHQGQAFAVCVSCLGRVLSLCLISVCYS